MGWERYPTTLPDQHGLRVLAVRYPRAVPAGTWADGVTQIECRPSVPARLWIRGAWVAGEVHNWALLEDIARDWLWIEPDYVPSRWRRGGGIWHGWAGWGEGAARRVAWVPSDRMMLDRQLGDPADQPLRQSVRQV